MLKIVLDLRGLGDRLIAAWSSWVALDLSLGAAAGVLPVRVERV